MRVCDGHFFFLKECSLPLAPVVLSFLGLHPVFAVHLHLDVNSEALLFGVE